MNSPHPSSGTNYIDLKTLILEPKPEGDPRIPGSDSLGIVMLFLVWLQGCHGSKKRLATLRVVWTGP